jgi:hypothetical protein
MYYCISYPSEKEFIFSVINNYFRISRELLVRSKIEVKKRTIESKEIL